MDNSIRHIKTHSIVTSRQETFEGRPHIVAPVILLVEGVHAGSGGPLFYSAEELRNSAQFWNGMPLPIHHPEINGQPVSCNRPEITEARSVGRLWNVVFEETPQPRLRGEVWIDVAKAQAISPAVLATLARNEPLEVSTGLFSRDESVSGFWGNERYVAIVHDIRPDHLALLPGAVGACSIADGCGIRSNNAQGGREVDKDFVTNVMVKVNREAERLLANGMSLSDQVSAVHRCVYSMDGPTADNYVEGVFNDHVIYRVEPGPQSMTGTQTRMYKRGYTMDENGACRLDDNMEEVRREINYVPVATRNEAEPQPKPKTTRRNNTQTEEESITANEEEPTMAVSEERKTQVTALISNGAFTEADRAFLENCDCPQFSRIESLANRPATAPVTNASETAVQPATFEQLLASAPESVRAQHSFMQNKFKEHRNSLITRIKANEHSKFTDPQLEAMDIELLEVTANSFAPVPTVNRYDGNLGNPPVQNSSNVEVLGLPTLAGK